MNEGSSQPAHPRPTPQPPEFSRAVSPADLTPTLRILLGGKTLTIEQTTRAFEAMMTGHAHHGEIGAVLALLATRLPTPDELCGAARVMRDKVDRVNSSCDPDHIVDTAGTGGAPKTFNVSTVAAIVAAGAGAVVAKHGNRSRTGRGSAEVLRQLGVNVDADRSVQARCLEQANVCFCFAIHHHPATRHVMPVRMALGFPTIFNLLGPLTNPAGARRQVMGVYDRSFLRPVADALAALGTIRAMVVHSQDGLDEISISAPTDIAHVAGGMVSEDQVSPESLQIPTAAMDEVVARDIEHAAELVRAILTGQDRGAPRNMTLLNAAATLIVADKAATFEQGLSLAAESIDSGAAMDALEKLVTLSNQQD